MTDAKRLFTLADADDAPALKMPDRSLAVARDEGERQRWPGGNPGGLGFFGGLSSAFAVGSVLGFAVG